MELQGCNPVEHSASPRGIPVSPEALDRAAGIFRALGEVSRLRLLAILGQGEACVSELAAVEKQDLSAISQRLRVLRAEGLVLRRRRGKHINYSLKDQHIVDLLFNALAHASEIPAHASETPAHASEIPAHASEIPAALTPPPDIEGETKS